VGFGWWESPLAQRWWAAAMSGAAGANGAFTAELLVQKVPAGNGGYPSSVGTVAGGKRRANALDEASVGSRMSQAVRSDLKGHAIENRAALETEVFAFLSALRDAYAVPSFQAEVRQLTREAAGNDVKHIMSLGPAAARVQGPVFERFGLPPGQRGIMLMKMAVKMLSEGCPALKDLAGDMRVLLGLPREEQEPVNISQLVGSAAASFKDLADKIARAPLDARGPLAQALELPYSASPEEIAREVPKIRQRATEIAERSLKKPRSEIIGEGKILAPEHLHATEAELRVKLTEAFDRYIQKMLMRVTTTVESFTKPPSEFRCDWADSVMCERHARELLGPQPVEDVPAGAKWLDLGVGVTVADGTLDLDLALRVRKELDECEAAGKVNPSKDPCNIGARSVWLHFETEEERQQLRPALREICAKLAGLPAALAERAAACRCGEETARRLRIHPHVMAATYRHGAEYHVHKDSYNGSDNTRMLTVLLYLNHEWQPGDDGELRVYGFAPDAKGEQADMDRFVDIEPLCGRLVIFRSREVWHAVRMPKDQRWALTLWVMAD